MIKPENIKGHLETITRHRHEVIKNCFKAGIGFQGLFHDLSKYSPTELIQSIIRETEALMKKNGNFTDIPKHGFITRGAINIIMNTGMIIIPGPKDLKLSKCLQDILLKWYVTE